MRVLTAAGLAVVLLAAPSPARAQTRGGTTPDAGGGSGVTVGLDPRIPVVGLPVAAVVRFSTLRPQTVTVFYRTVGTAPYVSLAAQPTGEPGVFRVSIPTAVPLSGIDAFAEYVVDGETRTEPTSSPALRPYRVPAFIPIARPDAPLPARQYRMVTVPLFLASQVPAGTTIDGIGSDEPDDVFGDDFGRGADPARWRLLRFDPAQNRSVDYAAARAAFGPVRPGEAYWLITATGGPFDVEAGVSTGVAFEGSQPFATALTVELAPGWNQIGSPFLFPVAWDDVDKPASVEDPVAFRGAYEPAQAVLEPWVGYFVFNTGGRTRLTFDALPGSGPSSQALRPADRLLTRTGGVVLDVRAEVGASADHVFLGIAAAGAGLELHKPPAIDDGLRLIVRDGERALAAAIRGATGTPRWDLDVGGVTGAFTLVFDAHREAGPAPAVTVEDLDRGGILPVVGGRAVVPAAGVPVRQLRVRLGAPEATHAAALGRPYPSPTRGAVAVPFLLPAPGPARVAVVDVLGRVVRIVHEGLLPGSGEVRWDGLDDAGRRVAPGLYVVRIEAASASAAVPVTVLP